MNKLTYNYALGTRHNNLTTNELQTLYEFLQNKESETVTDLADIKYSLKKIHEELLYRNQDDNTVKWPYIDAPYFTEEERLYYMDEHYRRDAGEHFANFHRVDPSIFRNRVQEIQALMKQTEDPEELMRLKNELIKLGWNPEVECNESNISKAKERILKIYNEELHNNCIIINSIDEVVKYPNMQVPIFESNTSIIPVNIIVFENKAIIQPHKLDNKDLFGECDIYTVYIPDTFIQEQVIESNTDSIFTPSTNYIAMKTIRESLQIPYNIIIHKVYSGDISKAKISSINNYNIGMVNKQ